MDEDEMNTRRRIVLVLGASALAAPFASFAQQPGKVWRIGQLEYGSRQSLLDSGRLAALVQGLREQGYIEGKNFVFEARYAEGDAKRLDALAVELVQKNVDLILATGTPASHAAKKATSTIPIVITAATDPVGDGFALSLARPGGNLTGLSSAAEDTVQKLLELTTVVLPKLKRIAVLTETGVTTHPGLFAQARDAGRKTGKQVVEYGVRTPEDIDAAFAKMAREKIEAVLILVSGLFFLKRAQIANLGLKHRIPCMFPSAGYAGADGLMSYGPELNENFRRAGLFVDKILKGAKPGEIPFEQPTRYYFQVNRRTAKALGIELSNEVLTRADRVVE